MAVTNRSDAETTVGYLNGQWRPADQLQISVGDLGFVQAVTAVERLRSYAGQLFQRPLHLERFRQTTSFLQLNLAGIDCDALLDELLDRNAAWIAAQGDFGMTLFATPGPLGTAEKTSHGTATVGLYCSRLNQPQIRQRQQFGQPLVVTDIQQPPPQCWPRHLKVRCRLHYYLADQAATARCAGALGVLLDQDGTLTETSVANLAIVRGERILSPPLDRILPGVTQRVLQSYAQRQQIEWLHQPLPPECLRDADEILLFGTTTGVWNGKLIDGSADSGEQPVDDVAPQGRMSRELRKALGACG